MIAITLSCFLAVQSFNVQTAEGSTLEQLRKQLEAAQQQYRAFQNRTKELGQQITNNRAKQSATKESINDLNRQIVVTEERLREVEQQLADAELAVQHAEEDLAEAIKELERREELRNRRVRAIYELGSVSYLEVLFNSKSFADFLSRYDQLQHIIKGDVSLLKDAQAQREEVEERKEQLEWKREQVALLKREVEVMRQALLDKKSEQEVQLASLQQIEHQLTEDLAKMDETLKETDRLINELTKKYQEAIRRTGSIVLRYPLEKQVPISSPFGNRYHPILKQYKLHTGTDFAASHGARVVAAESGTVILAGWNGGFGNCVIIAHGNNIVTLYAHLSKIHVSQGQQVERGQLIGLVGSTGLSTGPHLHFEVRVNNQPKNPMDYINRTI